MRVCSLFIENYRVVRRANIVFQDVTVFAGVNGAGKSTLLIGLSTLLSRAVTAIKSGRASGFTFDADDVKDDHSLLQAAVGLIYGTDFFEWSLSRSRSRTPGDEKNQDLSGARSLGDAIRRSLESEPAASVPVIVLYPVNRAVIDIPLRIIKKGIHDQLNAYDDALAGGSRNFRMFFEWFRNREDLENERRLDEPDHRDSQLEAVRQAVFRLMPGFANLRVRRHPLRMTVEKDGAEIRVDYLSDGEKVILALAGDLARRLAIANPGSSDPRQGAGVVLIDEIELHLHPAWQRKIVGRLQSAFPNCQFIATTHSPLVISELRREQVYRLMDGEAKLATGRTFGRPADEVLEDHMDVSGRPEAVKGKLTELFHAIDDDEAQRTRDLIADLEAEIGGDDADLVRARLMARRFRAS